MANQYRCKSKSVSRSRKLVLAASLLGVAALEMPTAAHAQAQVPGAQGVQGLPGGAGLLGPGIPGGVPAPAARTGTDAGDAADLIPKRSWSIVPRISLRETLTDNVAPSSGVKRSDQITEVSPGVRIDANGARLKFFLDYQLRELLYAQDSDRRNTQNYLNSFGTLEAIENWLFVDVSGVVTQQVISPFRAQPASNVTVDPNRVETSRFRASPYIRGNFSGHADYELRYSRASTQSSSNLVADLDTEEWSGRLAGSNTQALVGWALEGSRRNIDYSNGRNNEADRLRALLSYRLGQDFRVSVSGGQEANNYASTTKETHDTHGYGFDWLPSERTRVSAFRERRFFGNGHTVSVNHRTPLTAFRFSDSRDVTALPNRLAIVGMGSIYDLMFTQLASSVPDPIERARYLENLLTQFGIPADTVVTQGFMTSRVVLQRRQEMSFALRGARNVLTLTGVRTESEGLGSIAGANDIFASARNIRQRGFSINLAHLLTPLSTLNVTASRQNTSTSSGSTISTELKSLYVGVTSRIGPRSTASLGARRTLFDSPLIPYAEKALIASFTAQF